MIAENVVAVASIGDFAVGFRMPREEHLGPLGGAARVTHGKVLPDT